MEQNETIKKLKEQILTTYINTKLSWIDYDKLEYYQFYIKNEPNCVLYYYKCEDKPMCGHISILNKTDLAITQFYNNELEQLDKNDVFNIDFIESIDEFRNCKEYFNYDLVQKIIK